MIDRFFTDQILTPGQTITLTEGELKHLHVMRLKKGDEVQIINGKGQLAFGHVGDHIVIERVEKKPEPHPKLILALSIIRLSNLELVIEKGTELGVSEFWLFPAEHSEKDTFSPHQRTRLKTITISAVKQCGRLHLPSISEYPSLRDLPSFKGRTLFGDVRPDAPPITGKENTLFIVGPEKGFSEKEIAHLQKVATGVKLNENILRAETAAIAAAAILG